MEKGFAESARNIGKKLKNRLYDIRSDFLKVGRSIVFLTNSHQQDSYLTIQYAFGSMSYGGQRKSGQKAPTAQESQLDNDNYDDNDMRPSETFPPVHSPPPPTSASTFSKAHVSAATSPTTNQTSGHSSRWSSQVVYLRVMGRKGNGPNGSDTPILKQFKPSPLNYTIMGLFSKESNEVR